MGLTLTFQAQRDCGGSDGNRSLSLDGYYLTAEASGTVATNIADGVLRLRGGDFYIYSPTSTNSGDSNYYDGFSGSTITEIRITVKGVATYSVAPARNPYCSIGWGRVHKTNSNGNGIFSSTMSNASVEAGSSQEFVLNSSSDMLESTPTNYTCVCIRALNTDEMDILSLTIKYTCN